MQSRVIIYCAELHTISVTGIIQLKLKHSAGIWMVVQPVRLVDSLIQIVLLLQHMAMITIGLHKQRIKVRGAIATNLLCWLGLYAYWLSKFYSDLYKLVHP